MRHCRRTVVLAEVADVEIEGDGVQLGPGVNGQVRFSEDHGAGRAGRIGFTTKLMEDLPDGRQSRHRADRKAQFTQSIDALQQGARATAVMQFGDEMEAVHGASA